MSEDPDCFCENKLSASLEFLFSVFEKVILDNQSLLLEASFRQAHVWMFTTGAL